ncbi:MAG: chloride channel protein [Ruminococcus sp.]|nr:chloride channel protein [uncultured Ruminococcus sp.]MEE3334508.1 chloride channel protein [Ruminococcus sp.]
MAIKRYYKEASDLAAIGASATLATIFRSPMFGFVEPLEGEADAKLPKASKTVLYILATLSSFGIFIGLNRLTGGGTGFPSIGYGEIRITDYLWGLALTLAGAALGAVFLAFEKLSHLLLGLVKNVVIRCAIGGLALGGIGTLLPLTMFSSEHQIEEILENGACLGVFTLLLIAVTKLFLTSVCISSGLKGGHFFPVIFSGIAAGSALSIIIGIDSGFCMAAVTAALLGSTIRKPVAVTLLLLILFPWQLAPVMLGAAALGAFFDIPGFFAEKSK